MCTWDKLIKQCNSCKKCELYKTRTNVVIDRGNNAAPLMFIGEGPGRQEDLQGIPFVGAAGELLGLLLDALNIKEESYYITNIVKCRPPNNRVPLEEEANMCLPYLRSQTSLVRPEIIVCLGSTAMRYVIDKKARVTQSRGTWIKRKGFWLMPTFHPAALLRDKSKKILMWQDLKKVKKRLDEICQCAVC